VVLRGDPAWDALGLTEECSYDPGLARGHLGHLRVEPGGRAGAEHDQRREVRLLGAPPLALGKN
jgi:hypothetical protein